MRQNDPLLRPLRLKHLTLKNRIMSTSHAPGYVEDGHPKERYQLYHEEKAKGGLALTMFGGSSNVAPDSPSAFGQIDIGDDSILPHLEAFAARIHRHDCALMCQITHMGRRTSWNVEHWLPVIAPSPVREPQHRAFPKEMELHDIRRVVRAYGAAARRCKQGGLDGVELLATGHMIDQFWTPAVNRRSDAYGGSLENRMRFSFEVLEEVRRQVGDDYIVGLRMSGDEIWEEGLSAADCLEIAVRHAETGLLDYLNISGANVATDLGLSRMIPGMGEKTAPYLHLARGVRQAVDLPVFHATRIAELATARYAIEEGFADMVAMTRAHLTDPQIVNKLLRDETDRIRPCVGAGYCIDRIYEGGEALCLHNPATGREATMPQVIAKSEGPRRKVVVVGGGPAGLEAARVSAARGHRVVLFEATDRLGGQVNLAARVPRRRDMIGITDWLAAEVEALGVDLRLNHLAEADEVEAESPDIVVVATGGLPNTSFLTAGEELVASIWEVLGGQVEAKGEVLLYDDHGQHQGVSCAEFIAGKGNVKLEMATPDRSVAQEMGATNSPAYLEALYRHGVTLSPNLRLVAVRRAGNRLSAELRNEYTEQAEQRLVDQVIVHHGTLPADALYFALVEGARNGGETDIAALIASRPQTKVSNPAGRYQLFRVGDAVAGRNLHAAIYDSLRLCKEF
jgi:2,4-dienoyl-CoA reductase-like NADH-dependent reductase (Old Yellow Enzyme family)